MPHADLILIIDDEPQMRRLLEITLHDAGWRTATADTGAAGLVAAATHPPAAIVLDLGLPDIDGRVVLQRLREWSTIPVLVLTVRDGEEDIVGCLNSGADDYLTKPFRAGELTARIRTCLRHAEGRGMDEDSFACHGLTIDFVQRRVRRDGDDVHLTQTEYALLTLLVRNVNRVLTHRFILETVWGHAYMDETHYTRVYTAQLRKKIEPDPAHPSFIITESGIGYRFVCPDA